MDWLKDKKNQPFVIGGAVVLILAAIAFGLFEAGVFNQSNPTPVAATVPVAPAAAPTTAVPARRPRLAGVAGVAGATSLPATGAALPDAAAPAKVAVVDETKPINPAAVHDPFSNPVLPRVTGQTTKAIKQAVGSLALASVQGLVTPHDIYTGVSARSQIHLASAVNTGYLPSLSAPSNAALPRVAGVLFDRGVYAILQPAYGQAQSVKPGDTVSGVGRVTSIQPDSVTIKTISGPTVQLPVSAGPPLNNGNTPYGNPYGGSPYGNPYAGRPYGGSPYGGSPYGGSPYGGTPYGGGPDSPGPPDDSK